ncbi:MAG: nucleoside monophosphate kinase [Candidatus Taylorbacteria bacterium]|nr:nucleoside monophosphate kinase [Candidatus Taylorbacteria bacterium]
MHQTAIILMGRSGCGKGTQGTLLSEYLKKNSNEKRVLYLQSGSELREFIAHDGVTQRFAKEIYDRGDLEPEFLMIYMWANRMIQSYTGGEHLIIDGTPRKVHEAGVLHSLFGFYNLSKPFVVYINVPKSTSVERLLARGRGDDHKEEIEERLTWFDSNVIPTIEYYRNNPHYNFIEINGDRPIDVVHADIVEHIAKFS